MEELRRRDALEDERQKIATSKLSSSLVALPIVISLATTAFFTVLTFAIRFGWLGLISIALFVSAIGCFIVAAVVAIIGLWPMRSKYGAIGFRTILPPSAIPDYEAYQRALMKERVDAIKINGKVNADNLGLYARSSAWMVAGLSLLAVVVLLLAIAGFVWPERVLPATPSRAPSAATRVSPDPYSSQSHPRRANAVSERCRRHK